MTLKWCERCVGFEERWIHRFTYKKAHLTFQRLDFMGDFAEMKRILDAEDDQSA